MKGDIVKIAGFVHGYLMETGKRQSNDIWGPGYRWEHTLRVAHWAWKLAADENVAAEKCVVAALFHDVSHFVSENYREHGVRSAEIAKDFLVNENYPENFVEDVAYAARSHVGESNPKTIEAKILQDADTLDRFGCFRILLFSKTAELSNLKNLREKIQSSLQYMKKVERGEFGPMWTETGEAKLKELLNVNKAVLEGMLEELENTQDPETYFE